MKWIAYLPESKKYIYSKNVNVRLPLFARRFKSKNLAANYLIAKGFPNNYSLIKYDKADLTPEEAQNIIELQLNKHADKSEIFAESKIY